MSFFDRYTAPPGHLHYGHKPVCGEEALRSALYKPERWNALSATQRADLVKDANKHREERTKNFFRTRKQRKGATTDRLIRFVQNNPATFGVISHSLYTGDIESSTQPCFVSTRTRDRDAESADERRKNDANALRAARYSTRPELAEELLLKESYTDAEFFAAAFPGYTITSHELLRYMLLDVAQPR